MASLTNVSWWRKINHMNSHVLVDCYGCPREKLTNIDFIRETLDTLPAKINMTKVASPSVFKYEGRRVEDSGVSGVVLIAESHISIHTFPDKGHAFIDIFSRKEFAVDQALNELITIFGATRHELKMLNVVSDLENQAPDLVGSPQIYH